MVGVSGRVKKVMKARAPMIGSHVRRWTAPGVPPDPAVWGLSLGQTGLAIGTHPLREVAAAHGTPVHVVHLELVRERYLALRGPEGTSEQLDVSFSYKTNAVPGVLRELHELGAGAEVISEQELWLALKLGVPGERIIYNGPAKSRSSLMTAVMQGALININHVEEIHRIEHAAQAIGRPARVGVRITTELMWSGQFGCSLSDGMASAAITTARTSNHLRLEALHFHQGALMRTRQDLAIALYSVCSALRSIRNETGFSPSTLDLGGSLAAHHVAPISPAKRKLARVADVPIRPLAPSDPLPLQAYREMLIETLRNHYAGEGLPLPRLIIEPGRALTSSAQILLTSVLDVKKTSGRCYGILDAGVNLAPELGDQFHWVLPVSGCREETHQYRLVGPICSPHDIIADCWLGPHLQQGDLLAIMNTGAYFLAFSSSMAFPQPAIVAVDNDQIRIVRRAETFEDMVGRDAPTLFAK